MPRSSALAEPELQWAATAWTARAAGTTRSTGERADRPLVSPDTAAAALDEATLDRTREELRAALRIGAPDRDSVAMLAAIDRRRHALATAAAQRGVDSIALVRGAMQMLRHQESIEAVLAAVPTELLRVSRFERAMLSQVCGKTWTPVAVGHADGRRSTEVEDDARDLRPNGVETTAVRRRISLLSTAPAREIVVTDIRIAGCSTAHYAVAPIVVRGRAVGLLHADFTREPDRLAHSDLRTLASFADQFGFLYERMVLLEQLKAQRNRFRDDVLRVQAELECAGAAAVVLEHPPRAAHQPVSSLDGVGSRGDLSALFTEREREVLEALATGATNAEIAQRLTISQGTVKSHVKGILKKLQVTNRSHAVARYLQFKMRQRGREQR